MLSKLPTPLMNKNDWPWTEESQRISNAQADGFLWPKISIITPSFNQGEYIEETIRSVLLQGYPNLEYILIDGGSTDSSIEIIRRYRPWLTYWVSEPDRGQAHAINKGFAQATGEIAGWLNSDDVYFPGALFTMVAHWDANGRPNSLITGTKLKGNSTLSQVKRERQSPYTIEHLLEKCILEQPATFFPLDLFRNYGGLDERYQMVLDYDLWLRMTRQGVEIIFTGADLAVTRQHPLSKSSRLQRLSVNEAMHSVWRNYKVVPDVLLKKFVTVLVVPRGLESDNARRLFYGFRNILYTLLRSVLDYFHILARSEKR